MKGTNRRVTLSELRKRTGGRQLKKETLGLLRSPDFDEALAEVLDRPLKRVINPLFSFLCNNDETIRWRAIKAIGAVVKKLWTEDREAARIMMRRLMWTLNDESGGIGWGAPEAMGEIMAVNDALAEEYASVLVSYMDEDSNFLEHEPLQPGLLWAVARLGRVRPDLVRSAQDYLSFYLESENAVVRGYAIMLVGILKAEKLLPKVWGFLNDESEISLNIDDALVEKTIKELAEETVAQLDNTDSNGTEDTH